MTRLSRRRSAVADVRGGLQLAVDGVLGVTGIVESLHSRIARVSLPLGNVPERPARGIAGLVYRGVRGSARLVGQGLDAALAVLPQGVPADADDGGLAHEAVVSALNGVLGDHLLRTGNPLAIEMQLRTREPLDASNARPHVLLLIHGLCMNDRQWTRDGHDHGQALSKALGATAVYARYNSGLHISANGQEMARRIEELLASWPVEAKTLTVIGHSMGGLVARSAVHHARQAGMAWPDRLRDMFFLGSPHHGAPLERAGNWLHRGLGISPYAMPFTRLSGLRSEGIGDLRHGNLLDEDWAGDSRFAQRDRRTPVPLPAGVACYAVAGTLGRVDGAGTAKTGSVVTVARTAGENWLGDGLVPLASALGRHPQARRDLHFPPARTWVGRGIGHLDLLSSPAVHRQLLRWLAA
jgi:hypothetical protein